MSFLEKAWYRKAGWLISLWPLSILFQLLVLFRRWLQKIRSCPERISVPIVVVGNITAGGTGKTPLTIALARHLREKGFQPGIISRGYGGNAASYPMPVDANDNTTEAGDEPVMIAAATGFPVVVGPDRNAALQHLLATNEIDVVLSDDGLQHYKLYRDIEIAVVDGQRLFGNGLCFPAGPLREPISRLDSVDYVVVNGDNSAVHERAVVMEIEPKMFLNMANGEKRPFSGAPFNMGSTLQAVCGIGNPERFFSVLEKLPYPIDRFSFPDHYNFTAKDFLNAGIDEQRPLVMTEKDAIKCENFAKNNYWCLQVEINLPDSFLNEFTDKVRNSINVSD
ncbi:MAG: tetraacyldisaccharide 4'-kinase [Pseudohongiellaceae bacterium]